MRIKNILRRSINILVLMMFAFSSLFPSALFAQTTMHLPQPGQMIGLSEKFSPIVLQGVTIHPEDPLLFDFIVNHQGASVSVEELNQEAMKLVKYFLTGLSIKEDQLWVNLSPKEQDRIMDEALSHTDLGKELLIQDYILKQVMSTLLYPEKDLGRQFWKEVYAQVYQKFGHTNIEIDTFNKVWIMPEKAVVSQQGHQAVIKEARLKVLLESDYLSMKEEAPFVEEEAVTIAVKQITRSIVLPILEKEINEGKNFASLRQVYYSLILAGWYKNALKTMLLNQVYSDSHKVDGITIEDRHVREKVYQQYLEAYQKGVFNYVKEDIDLKTQQSFPRKYFSGGITQLSVSPDVIKEPAQLTDDVSIVSFKMEPLMQTDNPAQGLDVEKKILDPIIFESLGIDRPVKFGTSGDRGIIGEDFSFNHKNRVLMGIARYINIRNQGKRVYLGYDPRQDNKESVVDAARILVAYGMKVRVVLQEPTPVPVLAYLTGQDPDAVGMVVFTASHSPHTDGGVKFALADGGAAGEDVTDRITAYANDGNDVLMAKDYEQAKAIGVIEEITPQEAVNQYVHQYLIPQLKSVGAWEDILEYIQAHPRFNLILDPMQGTSVRYLKALYEAMEDTIGRPFTQMINDDNGDPTFRLVNHEPNPTKEMSRIKLVEKVKEGNGHWMGASTDADADRFGNIDFNAQAVSANDMIAMIAYFLNQEKGYTGRIGKSIVTSHFVNLVGHHLRLDVDEFPVGFKNAAKLIRSGKDYLVSGEESCHVLIGFLKESWDDGIAMGLMGLWIAAKTGKTLTDYKQYIQRKIGKKFFIDTITMRGEDSSFKKPVIDIIAKTKEELSKGRAVSELSVVKSFEHISREKVKEFSNIDGIKMVLNSGSWVAFRPSGTEPAIKITVEVAGEYKHDIEEMHGKWEKLFRMTQDLIFDHFEITDPAHGEFLDDEYDQDINPLLLQQRHGGIDLDLSQYLQIDFNDMKEQELQLNETQIMTLRQHLIGVAPILLTEPYGQKVLR